ncbi:MAG: deoxyribodipyrimidine photo-lyase [Bryobacteraceae bacterium]
MEDRVRPLNDLPLCSEAKYVLYWSQMNRRVEGNHALDYAVRQANELNLPVLYYEGLTCSYPWANDRFHTFLLEGVPDTSARLASLGIGYVFYLRRRQADPNNVLYQLAADAALVVTDDYPTFVAAKHNASVSKKIRVAFHAVDSSCIVPMNKMVKREWAAYTIRPKIHRMLPEYLNAVELPPVRRRYKGETPPYHVNVETLGIPSLVASCEIDHSVRPSISYRGGEQEAHLHLEHFLENNLRRYAGARNEPSQHATSDLSPYLHFGCISSLQTALLASAYAERHKLMAGEFLEELIVRRELAFNFARFATKPDSLDNLPEWVLRTLGDHIGDKREHAYDRDEFASASTHDALWNATQKEMLLRGKIHGYYRMYWGKKIIEWSRTYQDALDTMVYIHDRWALDGRDPNTYTNILWCFGLHDRPWQERAIFGKVRYMTLDGMRRKTNVDAYIREIELLERTGKDPFRLI